MEFRSALSYGHDLTHVRRAAECSIMKTKRTILPKQDGPFS